MAKLRLLGNRLVVAPLPPVIESTGGIAYALRYRDEDNLCRVIQIGPKVRDIKEGDLVVTALGIGGILHTFDDNVKIVDADKVVAVATTV